MGGASALQFLMLGCFTVVAHCNHPTQSQSYAGTTQLNGGPGSGAGALPRCPS
jgi:hypothetical protein